jgi:chromosome segregation ATPase
LKKAKKQADNAIKPLQEKHARVEGEVAQIVSRSSALEKKMKETRKQFDDSLKKSETMQDTMDEEINNLATIDAQQRLAEKQVEKERRRLQELEAEGADFPPMEEIEKALAETNSEIRAIKGKLDGVRRKHQSLQAVIEEKEEEKKDAEQKLNRVKDEKTIRMQSLFGANRNVKVIYDFVNQNRKIFRRPVWGPIGERCVIVCRYLIAPGPCLTANVFLSSRRGHATE